MIAMLPMLQGFAEQLPGPDVQIDFSRGDWWVAIVFYLFQQWLSSRLRNGPSQRSSK